jgi:hypothetical protein
MNTDQIALDHCFSAQKSSGKYLTRKVPGYGNLELG